MKKLLVVLMALTVTTSAKADGFKCEGVNSGVSVNVYNHTNPAEGTRTAAVMIVSDSYVNSPNKTIAKFTDANETLAYKGYGLFQATVDLRHKESSRKGENIAGTKLGQLKHINLQVFTKYGKFTYNNGLYLTEEMKMYHTFDSRLSYIKHNGEILEEKAICARYYK